MDEFVLRNDEPQPKVQPTAPATQKVLFAGMSCLPGQQDLFPTDGEADDDE